MNCSCLLGQSVGLISQKPREMFDFRDLMVLLYGTSHIQPSCQGQW